MVEKRTANEVARTGAPKEGTGQFAVREHSLIRQIFGYTVLIVGSLLLISDLFSGVKYFPLFVITVGALLIWPRVSGTYEQSRGPGTYEQPKGLKESATIPQRTRRYSLTQPSINGLQVGLGVVCVVAGIGTLLTQHRSFGVIASAIGPISILFGGLFVLAGPFVWRLVVAARSERAQRIRAQEREHVAAHLHDSVLQTLALIQRQPDDPKKIALLARRQERELRQWLFGTPRDGKPKLLSEALEAIAADVEELYEGHIDVVRTGDVQIDMHVEALVAACREATVNAAKFAGTESITVFAEVENGDVRIFVRDRGSGFNLAIVPSSRRGIRHSIVGRMEHHGGKVNITSSSDGTEVELFLPKQQTSLEIA